MPVLVSYATTSGPTEEIAAWTTEELRDAGLTVDVRRAADVQDITGYPASVLGGAMYVAGPHGDAWQFDHRFAGQPARGPVWLSSGGPLDSSADETELSPVLQVTEAMRALHACGHIMFRGRLSAEARGWPGFDTRLMASKGHDGDFRKPERVREWARGIAAEIASACRDSVSARSPSNTETRRVCHARA